jgi:hypothetical protein
MEFFMKYHYVSKNHKVSTIPSAKMNGDYCIDYVDENEETQRIIIHWEQLKELIEEANKKLEKFGDNLR